MDKTKIIVYTAITGGFEPDRDDVLVFNTYDRFKSDRLNAKIYKILPHLFLDCDISIWLDGNIRFAPGVEISKFTDHFLGEADMALFKHPWRRCAYHEADTCITLGLDDEELIKYQKVAYAGEGFPPDYGLWECGVLIRRHNERMKQVNEAWWAQICRFSSRDQISLPLVIWKYRPWLQTWVRNVREDYRFIYSQRQSSKA